MATTKSLRSITQIVAVGSVDGILTAAALLRIIGNAEVDIVFTQAFTVDKVDVSAWKPGRCVAFVDLAVNNRGKQMTAALVHRIREAGHELVAVCDEHSREDWAEILGTFEGLVIEPQSQAKGKYRSSGAVLFDAALDDEHLDGPAQMLCFAANKADRMVFEGVGALVNSAVKSRIADDSRRVYLARHFAQNVEPDSTIQGWIKEYEEILRNHEAILAAKQDLGDGIVRVSAVGKTVDMTTLMRQLYESGARIVVCESELFNRGLGRKTKQVAFGSGDNRLDLLAVIKPSVPTASGVASKANVEPGYEQVALAAIRRTLAPDEPKCPECGNAGGIQGVPGWGPCGTCGREGRNTV